MRKTFKATFIEYRRPNGRRFPTGIDLPAENQNEFHVMEEAGFRLAAETLMNGRTVAYIENSERNADALVVKEDLAAAFVVMLKRKLWENPEPEEF